MEEHGFTPARKPFIHFYKPVDHHLDDNAIFSLVKGRKIKVAAFPLRVFWFARMMMT